MSGCEPYLGSEAQAPKRKTQNKKAAFFTKATFLKLKISIKLWQVRMNTYRRRRLMIIP